MRQRNSGEGHHLSSKDPITAACRLPSGARFFKCALQVNPFAYLEAHGRPLIFSGERSYNEAIVEACQELEIEVIGITDHYRVRSSEGLIDCAQRAGLFVIPGFEAVTKDGVHILCFFDPGTDLNTLDRILGDCGIYDDHQGSPVGKYDALEFFQESRDWGAICVAAHVASDGGLLNKLSGQSRANAWQSRDLLACSLPGAIEYAPDGLRPILKNKNPDYLRPRAVAVINAKDVNGPDDLRDPGATCWIKMSEITVEGLRQAFLDPGSRIRLSNDPVPEEHAELAALAWEGGFLDGVAIHLNPNFNVLVGGRGAGKSTVVESLRYVLGLEPIGDEANKAHKGIVREVLRSGTKISLLARSYRPVERKYRIERTVPNPPVVRDDAGEISNLTPEEVLPRVEVYGQHEISELTRSGEKLTRLLDRFAERDALLDRQKVNVKRGLEKTRRLLQDVRGELHQIEEGLAALPALEETLQGYQDAGLEDRLKERSLLVREEQVLATIPERLLPIRECLEHLSQELPIDRVFLSVRALEELPGKAILAQASEILDRLSRELEKALRNAEKSMRRADDEISDVQERWQERKRNVKTEYEKILRELKRSAVDGEEFIRLRREIEGLRPLRERQALLRRTEKEHADRRRALLAEWEDLKAEEFRLLDRAAKRVSYQLKGAVQVDVTAAGDQEPLFRLLRKDIAGRLSEAIESLSMVKAFSLPRFVESCRAGSETVQKEYRIPPAQAERLAKAPPEVLLRVEELELPATTAIKLNTAPFGDPPDWQALDELSTGQKATAVLLLLLLESDAPLIVDQPEDDLDNRFITEGVVPRLREEKRRRQFLFSTHNANVPVLGDAELILALTPSGEAERGNAQVSPEHMGSIDSQAVRELVEEILEGGKEAFEMRRLKYGF